MKRGGWCCSVYVLHMQNTPFLFVGDNVTPNIEQSLKSIAYTCISIYTPFTYKTLIIFF